MTERLTLSYRGTDTSCMEWTELILRLRSRGWTQVLLAERVGTQQSVISDLSRGATRDPRYSLASALVELDTSGETPQEKAA